MPWVPVAGGGGGAVSAVDGYLQVGPADVSVGQSFTTTPTKVAFWANPKSNGVTASTTTYDLTVVTSGQYDIVASVSGSGPASAVEWNFAIYVDGASPGAGMEFGVRRDTTLTANGSLAFPGDLTLTAGQKVTMYGWSDSAGGQTFVPVYGLLKITRVGA
jgi:hypothetical protein